MFACYIVTIKEDDDLLLYRIFLLQSAMLIYAITFRICTCIFSRVLHGLQQRLMMHKTVQVKICEYLKTKPILKLWIPVKRKSVNSLLFLAEWNMDK